MSGQNAAQPQLCYDVPRLVQLFESLGENCDFGVVQRAVGVEPLGLFRFSACTAIDVAALLRERFRLLGEPADLWLEPVGPRREYWVNSHSCSFQAHTERYADVDDPDTVRAAQLEKMRFLKARLLRELAFGRRIFVFKGAADPATIREMATQLRTYGPNWLLWVNIADDAHPPGVVERVFDGLLCGFVGAFGTYDGDPSLPVEDWVAVCANAYRLWRDADPPKASVENLIGRAVAAGACQWFVGSSAHPSRSLGNPVATGAIVLEHRLTKAETMSVHGAYLPTDGGGSFVLSIWVRIPATFTGRQIGALLTGFASTSMWTADLNSRGRWQRIWVTAELPVDATSIFCDLIAEGAVGDCFESSSWCLERGVRPLGYGFSL